MGPYSPPVENHCFRIPKFKFSRTLPPGAPLFSNTFHTVVHLVSDLPGFLSIRFSIYPFSIRFPIYWVFYLFSLLSTWFPIYPGSHLHGFPPTRVPIYSVSYLFGFLSTRFAIYLFFYLSGFLFTRLTIYPVFYLLVFFLSIRFPIYPVSYLPGFLLIQFSIYPVYYLPGSLFTRFSIYPVSYQPGFPSTQFPIYSVSYLLSFLSTRFSIYPVSYLPDPSCYLSFFFLSIFYSLFLFVFRFPLIFWFCRKRKSIDTFYKVQCYERWRWARIRYNGGLTFRESLRGGQECEGWEETASWVVRASSQNSLLVNMLLGKSSAFLNIIHLVTQLSFFYF